MKCSSCSVDLTEDEIASFEKDQEQGHTEPICYNCFDSTSEEDPYAEPGWRDKVVDAARYEGNKIVVKSKKTPPTTIWAGLGNRSGLHSYANTVLSDKWKKSGNNFMKKLDAYPTGTVFEIHRFANVTRDRGTWKLAYTITKE